MDEYTNYLAHHGIKGQKWGVRRFQNADGSLTLRGRVRYGLSPVSKDPKKLKAKILADVKKHNAKVKAKETARAKAEEKAEDIRNKQKKSNEKLAKYKEKLDREERMKTPEGAANESLNMTAKQIERETARYKAAADFISEKSRMDKYVSDYAPKAKSKYDLEKIVYTADKLAQLAGSAEKIYKSYNSIFGNGKSSEKSITSNSAMSYMNDGTLLNAASKILTGNKSSISQNKAKEIVRSMSDKELSRAIERSNKEKQFMDLMLKAEKSSNNKHNNNQNNFGKQDSKNKKKK